MERLGAMVAKLLSLAKAILSSGERPVLRITTLGWLRLKALANCSSEDFRLVILYLIPFFSSWLRNPNVKTPFLLVESLQSMKMGWWLGKRSMKALIDWLVVAETDCGILQIPKAVYVKMIQNEEVLLFNILNYLSRNSQNRLWTFSSKSSGKFTTRLAIMTYELTTKKSENIKFTFKQKDLCMLLGIRRTSLFTSLEELKQKGIIHYTQNEIHILNRRDLINMIHK